MKITGNVIGTRRGEWLCALMTFFCLGGGIGFVYSHDSLGAFTCGFGTAIWYGNWGHNRDMR